MKKKILKVKVSTNEEYLMLFNGMFNLTPSEIKVLAQFIDIHKRLKEAKVDISPFSTEMRKTVQEELEITSLRNYIRNLSDKKAIFKKDNSYIINPILIPSGEKELIFRLNDTR